MPLAPENRDRLRNRHFDHVEGAFALGLISAQPLTNFSFVCEPPEHLIEQGAKPRLGIDITDYCHLQGWTLQKPVVPKSACKSAAVIVGR